MHRGRVLLRIDLALSKLSDQDLLLVAEVADEMAEQSPRKVPPARESGPMTTKQILREVTGAASARV